MTASTPLLGSLSQHQGPFGTVGSLKPFRAALPEASECDLEAGASALPSWSFIEELQRGQYQAQPLAGEANVPGRMDQYDFLLSERWEFLSDLIKSGSTEAEEPITFASRLAKASPNRGRITGPVQFVNHLLATWDLKPKAACILLGFEPSRVAHVNDVLQGYQTLAGRDAKDRISHLFQIRKLLSALFQDEAVENEWLREPRDVLKGKTPMDLLLEGSMENLLLVREYVELVTGR